LAVYTRRQALGLAVGAATTVPAIAAVRPNILWISCEDINPNLGCYGDPHAHSPNIDRLARQGVRYTRAFTVAGVCAPSRSGIITGMYPSTLGSVHMRCRAMLPEFVKPFPQYLRRAGYYCTNNSKQDYNFNTPPGTWDESSRKAHWRNRKPGQPFFAVFNLTVTHESRILPRGPEHEKLVARLTPDQRQDPAALTVPPYYPDTPVVRRDLANYYELITAMDYLAGDHLHELEQAGLAEDTIVFFWSDHGVGLPRAKRWLYDSGTHVPLVVRIPEKLRAEGQARPGTVSDELVSFIDLGPTVLNLAGLPVPEYMQGRPFLGPRLPPPRRYVYGARDRMDERYDIIRTVRDQRWRYIRNYENYKPYYQYMNTPEKGTTMKELRRLHQAGKLPQAAEQFMADHKPVEELYDTQKDPYEIHNLAASPEHRATLERLRAAHQQWMEETRDVGLIPEPELVEREKKLGSRYAILRQPGTRDLPRRLRAAADLAGQGPSALPKLEKLLSDPEAALRYWAAIGLGNLAGKASRAAGALKQALRDSSPVVRIAAARALCRMDRLKEALPVLERELASEQEWVRLNAAIVLDELGARARPAIPALHQALKDKQNKYVVRVANHALNALEGTHRVVR